MSEVIACIDGSRGTPAVCEGATWAADRLDAPLTLLHVLDHADYPSQRDLSGSIGMDAQEHLLEELAELDHQRSRLALKQGKLMLDSALQQVKENSGLQAQSLQRHGSLLETLRELENRLQILVMGRQGEAHELETAGIGSQLESVIRTLSCPILITLPNYRQPERFSIAYDGSANAKKMLSWVAGNPLFKGTLCHLVMAGESSVSNERALREAHDALRPSDLRVETALLPGDITEALTSYNDAHQIDLMVMGAYGHSRIRQFLVGSNTTRMLQKTHVPLLLWR